MNHTDTTLYRLLHPSPRIRRLVDELTYRSYRANRNYDPTITPERWRQVYDPENKGIVEAFEARYQKERSHAN